MADVFISYHETSAGELAQQIAVALEWRGMSCWLARRDMIFGGNFANEIPPQINACKLFLLLLDEQGCQSMHIANELTLAFGRLNKRNDIKILPLKIGKFQEPDWIHYFLALIQTFPLSAQPDSQELYQLAAYIAQTLHRAPTQELPPRQSPQAEVIDSGKCGNNVTYTLDTTGRLRIFGFGPMRNYTMGKRASWYPQRYRIFNVYIEKGVTSIGDFAFSNCENLTSVHIPLSVTSIGCGAFIKCASLKRVRVPAKVVIGPYVFDSPTQVTRRKKP